MNVAVGKLAVSSPWLTSWPSRRWSSLWSAVRSAVIVAAVSWVPVIGERAADAGRPPHRRIRADIGELLLEPVPHERIGRVGRRPDRGIDIPRPGQSAGGEWARHGSGWQHEGLGADRGRAGRPQEEVPQAVATGRDEHDHDGDGDDRQVAPSSAMGRVRDGHRDLLGGRRGRRPGRVLSCPGCHVIETTGRPRPDVAWSAIRAGRITCPRRPAGGPTCSGSSPRWPAVPACRFRRLPAPSRRGLPSSEPGWPH